MEGVWIAGDDGIFDEPIADPTRLDEAYNVRSIRIRRGRQDEFADVPTGECEIDFVDKVSSFNPAPLDSKQAGVAIRNPVTDTWHDLFRGLVDETEIDISPAQVKRDVRLKLVDWLDYFATVEMHPGFFGDTPPAGYERQVFFEDGVPVDDRIIQLLGNAGFPADLTRIFSGNVSVSESLYSPGEALLSAIDEACEAEFPGVAIRFVSKTGVFTFHGRLARFRPDVAQYDIGDWECGDGAAVHADNPITRAQIRPPLTGRRNRNRVINRALIYPKFVNGRAITDAQIAAAVVEDTASQADHGIRSYTVPDLIMAHSYLGNQNGLAECEMIAQHFVDQFSAPATKLQQVSFRTLPPSDPRAAANWALICGVEISDRLNVLISGSHGQELSGDYFVEGISYDIRPMVSTLDLGYPWVEMTLDISPRLYWQNDPWAAFTLTRPSGAATVAARAPTPTVVVS